MGIAEVCFDLGVFAKVMMVSELGSPFNCLAGAQDRIVEGDGLTHLAWLAQQGRATDRQSTARCSATIWMRVCDDQDESR